MVEWLTFRYQQTFNVCWTVNSMIETIFDMRFIVLWKCSYETIIMSPKKTMCHLNILDMLKMVNPQISFVYRETNSIVSLSLTKNKI
jgi:hypothetical protein